MKASILSLLAIAGATTALDASAEGDADVHIWESLPSLTPRPNRHASNRPFKRQDGWSPPSELTSPLEEVWQHCVDTYTDGLFGFINYGWDQIMATQGRGSPPTTINYCVRWESDTAVTEAQRTQIASKVAEQYQLWFEWLYGYDTFPFSDIVVNVVGWAVKDESLLQGPTDDIDVYTNTDSDGAPECLPACGRFFNQGGNYSECPGGEASHYDHSLWLTDGFGGGAGGDWGQRLGRESFMDAIDSASMTILLHEMGHTFGLDDFYDWTPTGIDNFIMLSGSSMEITDFDGWMLRNWWYELSRNRGW